MIWLGYFSRHDSPAELGTPPMATRAPAPAPRGIAPADPRHGRAAAERALRPPDAPDHPRRARARDQLPRRRPQRSRPQRDDRLGRRQRAAVSVPDRLPEPAAALPPSPAQPLTDAAWDEPARAVFPLRAVRPAARARLRRAA